MNTYNEIQPILFRAKIEHLESFFFVDFSSEGRSADAELRDGQIGVRDHSHSDPIGNRLKEQGTKY